VFLFVLIKLNLVLRVKICIISNNQDCTTKLLL